MHVRSAHPHTGSPPTVVVYPLSTEDVVKIVNIARSHLVPVITYGGGTSLEGHWRAPPDGAICVDVSHMDKILEIHGACRVFPILNMY